MAKMMQRDESDVAEAVASYLAVGGDRIATGHGDATLHVVHVSGLQMPGPSIVLARLADGSEYRLSIAAARVRP